MKTITPSQAYIVKDHKEFAAFNYEQHETNQVAKLGMVVKKDNEIGVIIQLHKDGDIRTDMWGNCSPSECDIATIEQVTKFRPDLLDKLKPF